MRLFIKILFTIFIFNSIANATIGFFQGKETKGNTKICYYKALSSTYSTTIDALDFYPTTYKF
jgi:hypothetical protein